MGWDAYISVNGDEVDSYKGENAVIKYYRRDEDEKFERININFSSDANYGQRNLVVYIIEESVGSLNFVDDSILVENAVVHTEYLYGDNYDDSSETYWGDTYIDINEYVKKECKLVKVLVAFDGCYIFTEKDFQLHEERCSDEQDKESSDYSSCSCCTNSDEEDNTSNSKNNNNDDNNLEENKNEFQLDMNVENSSDDKNNSCHNNNNNLEENNLERK